MNRVDVVDLVVDLADVDLDLDRADVDVDIDLVDVNLDVDLVDVDLDVCICWGTYVWQPSGQRSAGRPAKRWDDGDPLLSF